MRILLFIFLVVFFTKYAESAGPLYKHEAQENREFSNVYSEMRRVLPKFGSQPSSGTVLTGQGSGIEPQWLPPVVSTTFSSVSISSLTVNGTLNIVPPAGSTYAFQVAGVFISSGGVITSTNQPSFLYANFSNQSNITGATRESIVSFPDRIFDIGSGVSNSSFTCTVAGKYVFTASIFYTGYTSSHGDTHLLLYTTKRRYRTFSPNYGSATNDRIFTINTPAVDMEVGDKAWVNVIVSQGTQVISILGDGSNDFYTYFGGRLDH